MMNKNPIIEKSTLTNNVDEIQIQNSERLQKQAIKSQYKTIQFDYKYNDIQQYNEMNQFINQSELENYITNNQQQNEFSHNYKQLISIRWNKNINYSLLQHKINKIMLLLQSNKSSHYNNNKIVKIIVIPKSQIPSIINNNSLLSMIKKYDQQQLKDQNNNNNNILLGGGQCSGKSSSQYKKTQKQPINLQKNQSILVDEKKEKKEEEKKIENYTYQMSEEQQEKMNDILKKLNFQSPKEDIHSRFVSQLFLEMYEIFSSVLSKGITNAQTQQLFQQLLEGGVNFLLSLIYSADKQKQDIFDPKMRDRILEKIKKTINLFKSYESRLPLQIGIYLLKFQRKIVQLKRKQLSENVQNKVMIFEYDGWKEQHIRFCFSGFEDIHQNNIQNLINSLSIYYEFNKKQKFVVDILKTEYNIIKKYSDVAKRTVEFEEYFSQILQDYENKSFGSIFYAYLMLYDQIFENAKNLEEIEIDNKKKNEILEQAGHFIKLVIGDNFIELCRRTFYFENIKMVQQSKRQFVKQLEENFSLRYVELKILVQTQKLIKIYERKSNLSEAFSSKELNLISRLEVQIFEKFLQESSSEVNCLIFDDEPMLQLIEHLNGSLDNSYFNELKQQSKIQKQRLEQMILEVMNLQDVCSLNNEKQNHMIDQFLGRKITYSIVMNYPKTAICNRFVEAFINRISSKKSESQHEKGQKIHVNQRLKFISNNALSRSELNVNGLVEDSLQMLEKVFLAESNTQLSVVAIKGGPGMGKTHICRELMRRLMKQIQDTGSRSIAIPIMVEMIEAENISSHLDLETFLNHSIERYAFRSTKEISYLKNSSIPKVIILDGISEWGWGSPSTSLRDWIRLREWQNTKLIITYRRPFVRAEEFPYFFGLKCMQPQDFIQENDENKKKQVSLPYNMGRNFYCVDNHQKQPGNMFQEDDREKCFEVFQILSLNQDGVEDYIRQKEVQVRIDVRGRERRGSLSLDSSMVSGVHPPSNQNKSISVIKDIEPGFLLNTFRACTRKNTHLIDMLEIPFNLFCFAEILAKVQGIKEIYWGGGGTNEERKSAATWLMNLEEMQEKLFIEEINGLVQELDLEESLRPLCQENLIEYFQSLAMNLFVERKFKVSLQEIQNLMSKQMRSILKSGGKQQEINALEKLIVCTIQNIQRTSFLASSDISFFEFINGVQGDQEQEQEMLDIGSMREFQKQFEQKAPPNALPPSSQLYSFRNTPWLEFLIARAMKYDFDKYKNTLHNISVQELSKFSINSRYLLEERSAGEHNPFSISQQTHHASVEMNILKKLAIIIRKDLLGEDFQNKIIEKDISKQNRYIQMITKTRRIPQKFYQKKNQAQQDQAGLDEWVIKHQKHPLDIASSNILSAICFNKLSLKNVKLRNCSFSRCYMYGYRGDLDIACSDVSESNLRGSYLFISRSKFQHCLLDDEKNNHERWNSNHIYSFSALHFANSNKLISGSYFGGLSIFSAVPPPKQKIVKKKESKKQKEDQVLQNALIVSDKNFQPTQFWQLASYQRQYQEEIRAIATFQGDIYYAFLNIIAHVTEHGEEKEILIGHQNKINDIAISEKRSTLATVSSDHSIRIWGITNPEVEKKKQGKQSTNGKQKNGKVTEQAYDDGDMGEDSQQDDLDEDVEESFAEMELLHTLNRHQAEVICCSYSPNGLYLATGSYDETIFIWEIASGYKNSIHLSIKSDWINSLQFSNDSTMLVAGSSQSYIKIWDATNKEFPSLQLISTKRQRRDSVILGNTENKNDCIGGVSCVRFSPNNKFLIFSTFDEPGIQVWELIPKSSPKKYAISEINRQIFLDESVMNSDYNTQRMPYFLINSFEFSQDGKYLAVSSSNLTLCSIWNVDEHFKLPKKTTQVDGEPTIAPSAFKLNNVISPNKVAAMAISHDGRYLATCAGLASPHKDSCRITIWNIIKKGEQALIIQTLDTGLHSQAVTCLSFSQDNGFLVSASEDDHFVAWKNVVDPITASTILQRQNSQDSRRQSIIPPSRGSIQSTSLASSMNLEAFKKVLAHKKPISSIAFSTDNRYLVSTSAPEKSCKVWDAHTFDFIHQIEWEEELAISKLQFSPNGLFLATLPLPSVVTNTISSVYQKRKGSRRMTIQRKESAVKERAPTIIRNQQQMNNEQEKTRSSCCFIWNANDRFSYNGIVGTVKTQVGHANQTQIISICFSKDSQLFVTGQTNGLCNVWDASNRFHFIQSIDAHFGPVTHITFSGDSQMLATTSFDQKCKVWHIPNRFHEISSFPVPLETSEIYFVRQGHSIAVASTSDEFSLKFVDIYAPSYRIEELRAHSAPISQVTFSNDGRFLLTASQDNTVRIWDLKNYFFQHYTININFKQNTNNTVDLQQQNTLSKQEQKQDDDQLESINKENDEENSKEGGNRYKDYKLQPITKKKTTLKHDIYFSIEDPDLEDEIYETEDQHIKSKKEIQQKNNNIENKAGGGTMKRKKSFLAAPNLKPSQLYQQKVKDQNKDENINEEDYKSSGGIITAAISEIGTFVFVVTAESPTQVSLYDFTRGVDDVRESVILEDHTDSITCLAISQKDEYIATGCANTEIRIWKRTSLSPLFCEFELHKVIEGRHTKAVSCIAFSPNMKYFASGSWDITCKVYDVENDFKLIHNLDGQYGYLLSLAFSPCSTKLAITSRDNSCYVWNVENRLTEEELFDHRQPVTSCSYSPYFLATASKDQSFILYDINDNYKLSKKIEGLPESVTNSSLSPDGKYLVVGLQNSLCQVWDLYNRYDLTNELLKDKMYQDVLEMEKSFNQQAAEYNPQNNSSICNFIGEDDIKEQQNQPLNQDEFNNPPQNEDMQKQIPQMKREIITSVLKQTYEQYKDSNHLTLDIQYTPDNHILVTIPKYPMCLVTL